MKLFAQHQHLWQKNPSEQLDKFLATNPGVSEFESQLKFYENLIVTINGSAKFLVVGPLAIFTGFSSLFSVRQNSPRRFLEHVKFALTQEIRQWIVRYVQLCNKKYREEMNEIFKFIQQIDKRLSREIKDLEDIRLVMMAVKDLREHEIQIEMQIIPIEESYSMLQKYDVFIPREDTEHADSLRYQWTRVQQRCVRRSPSPSPHSSLSSPFRRK